ncbi:hypothetical protein TWF696_004546 [Orbilia brochopaga]|uniref:Uncharacterized protein n=1 Tax=Orbilia brochopaga TaxID=3140254 RepID=A0AAV9V9F1_9PEZI
MAVKPLSSMFKSHASISLYSRGHTHRLMTTSRIRHFSQGPRLQSPTDAPITTTLVTEFEKAGVRCTSSGIEAFNLAYASTPYRHVFNGKRSDKWPLYTGLHDAVSGPLYVDTPDSLSHENANIRGERWRSREAYRICMQYKAYKVLESLHAHSALFRQLIDLEEKEWRTPHIGGDGPHDSELWWWMESVIEEGLVDRGDVDDLPEPFMLRDIVVPSE